MVNKRAFILINGGVPMPVHLIWVHKCSIKVHAEKYKPATAYFFKKIGQRLRPSQGILVTLHWLYEEVP